MNQEPKKESLFFRVLQRKGPLATLLGLLIAIPINARMLYIFFLMARDMKMEPPWGMLAVALIMNMIAIMWVILPSKIEISGKLFNLKVED